MNKVVSKGIGLVEVVLAAAIILSTITILVSVNNIYLKVSSSNIKSVKAQLVLEEGIEAVRIIRDGGWTANIATLSNDVTYQLFFNTTTNVWSATTTTQYVDNIKRTFVLDSVYRDSNDDIADSGSTDNGSRKVVMTVEWPGFTGTSTDSITTYITNIYND